MSVSSNYHIEVNPSDAGIYDRIVVMELIKNAAQTHQLDSSSQREFKGCMSYGLFSLLNAVSTSYIILLNICLHCCVLLFNL